MRNLLFFVLAVGVFISCEYDRNNYPFDMEFKILDSDREIRTIFSYGEDVLFTMEITNFTDTTILYVDGLRTFDFKRMYTVYRETINDAGDKEYVLYGTPYPEKNFMYMHEYYIRFNPGKQYFMIAPWLFDPYNQPLPPGYYKSAFDITIYFQDYEPVNKSFEKFFTVE